MGDDAALKFPHQLAISDFDGLGLVTFLDYKTNYIIHSKRAKD